MSLVDKAIDSPWRNLLTPEFVTKFDGEVAIYLEITKFPCKTV